MITIELPGTGNVALLVMLVVAGIDENDGTLFEARVVKQLLGLVAIDYLQAFFPEPREGILGG